MICHYLMGLVAHSFVQVHCLGRGCLLKNLPIQTIHKWRACQDRTRQAHSLWQCPFYPDRASVYPCGLWPEHVSHLKCPGSPVHKGVLRLEPGWTLSNKTCLFERKLYSFIGYLEILPSLSPIFWRNWLWLCQQVLVQAEDGIKHLMKVHAYGFPRANEVKVYDSILFVMR